MQDKLVDMRVADYLIDKLEQEGVDTIFGITGGGIMHLIDALSLSETIKLQPVHHEEFAGVCADGYARSGKKLGVVFATTGPGIAHLFTSTAAAWHDSVPVLIIAGQVKTTDSSRLRGINLRQNGTFEFDSIAPFSHITKKAMIVKTALEAVAAINEAILLCQSIRPGPVLIEIPLNVQAMKVPKSVESISIGKEEINKHDKLIVRQFSESLSTALKGASRPIVLLGAGVVRSNSECLVNELFSSIKIPYVVTQFARALGNSEHQLFLGSPGVKANKSANLGLAEADLIIAIGTSLHQQVIGWNEKAFQDLNSIKIWTEIDSETLKSRRHLVDEAFPLESSKSLAILSNCLKVSSIETAKLDPWRERCEFLRANFLLHYPTQVGEKGRFSLYNAISILSNNASRFKSVTTDAGLVWYAVPQHFFLRRNSYFISSGSFGSMGMALPLAIGSATATKQATLCITGDGSLMTCLQELSTLAYSKLPILLIINSNDGYASIKTTHDKFFAGRRIGTDSSNGVFIPSFKKVADSFGIPYAIASSERELEQILESEMCQASKLPLIIDIMTLIDQAIEPVVISKLNPLSGEMESGSLIDLYPESLR